MTDPAVEDVAFTVEELELLKAALTKPLCWKPAVVDEALALVEARLAQQQSLFAVGP